MQGTMTRNAFIRYAHQVLSRDALEPLYERIGEHNSEVTGFGDSWPGAMLELYKSIDEANSIERQLARLEGREPRNFQFRVSSPR